METLKKGINLLWRITVWLFQAANKAVRWAFQTGVKISRRWWGKLQSENNTHSALWAVGGLTVIASFCCVSGLAFISIFSDGSPPTEVATSPDGLLTATQVEETAVPKATQANTKIAAEEAASTEDVKPTNVPTMTKEPTMAPTQTSTQTVTPRPTSTYTPRPTNTRLPSATPYPQLRVVSSSANLRSGPGTNYGVAGVVSSGDTVTVLARTADSSWYNVRLDSGTRAWVAASVVEPMNFPSAIAIGVVATIPAPPVVIATTAPIPTSPPVAQATATFPPAATEPPAPPPVVGSCTCSGPDLNCGDFPTHAAAQACYDYCMIVTGYDYYDLDGNDSDGLACESLP